MRMVKYGGDCNTEARFALVASPPVLIASYVDGAAIGAARVVPPSGFLKMFDAGFLVWKPFEYVYNIRDTPLLVGVNRSS